MHEGRAGVAQIVEADLAKPVLLEKLRKGVLDVSRLETVAKLVREHVVKILRVIAVTAEFAVALLHVLPCKKLFLQTFRHGKRAVAGFGFRAVGCDDDRFAVDACVCDGVVDGDRIFLEVNGFPPKSKHLTAAQAEKRGDVDEKPQLVIGSFLDQLRKLLLGVERTFIAFSLRRIDFIHRVVRN